MSWHQRRVWDRFPPARWLHRGHIAWRYLAPQISLALRWVPRRTENSNFYYRLDSKNLSDLAASLALVFDTSVSTFDRYFEEIASDQQLKNHVEVWRQNRDMLADSNLGFGRRVVWYAIARYIRPRLIVETGVYHGLGSVVLASALRRNAEEGFPGRYLETELNPEFGSLFSGRFSELGEIIYGDSVETLSTLEGPVDLFINDSDHSIGYEALEYETVEGLLSTEGVVIGDNSHVTSVLNDWSRSQRRRFIFLPEVSTEHFYPWAGVGISLSARPDDS